MLDLSYKIEICWCNASAILIFFRSVRNYGETKTPAKHRDIFPDAFIAKKYGEGEDRTHDLLAGKHEKISSTSPGSNPRPIGAWGSISEVHLTRWSGDKVEFWQNL